MLRLTGAGCMLLQYFSLVERGVKKTNPVNDGQPFECQVLPGSQRDQM